MIYSEDEKEYHRILDLSKEIKPQLDLELEAQRLHILIDGLSLHRMVCPGVITIGQINSIMGRDPVELAKRAKYQPPAMRVRGVCYTKKSPFRYNKVVQANL